MVNTLRFFKDKILLRWLGVFSLLWYFYIYFTDTWENPITIIPVMLIILTVFLGQFRASNTIFRPFKDAGELHVWHCIADKVDKSAEIAAIILAGIIVLIISKFPIAQEMPHFHIPYNAVLTIIGIMVVANNAMNEIVTKLDVIEEKIGTYWTLVFLSLFSSVTGEVANAKIQTEYLKPRLPDCNEEKTKVAVGISLTIGAGGGLTFFSPPAVMVIWATLNSTFNWGMGTLIATVGLIAVVYVLICTGLYSGYLKDKQHIEKVPGDYTVGNRSIYVMLTVIGMHIASSVLENSIIMSLTMTIDVILGFWCLTVAINAQRGKIFDIHIFERDAQPLLIGLLLVAIEVFGVIAEPGIRYIGQTIDLDGIPATLLPLILATVLFVLSGVTSALVDNALATKVLIIIPITIAETLLLSGASLDYASIVAQSGVVGMIAGALLVGWVTVQGNLPNILVKQEMDISPIEWINLGIRKYMWTLAFGIITMGLVVHFVVPQVTNHIAV